MAEQVATLALLAHTSHARHKNHAHYALQECLVQGNQTLASRARQDSFRTQKVAHPANYAALENQQMEKVIQKAARRVVLEAGNTVKVKRFVKDVRLANFQCWRKVRSTIVQVAFLANIPTEYEVLSAFAAQQVNTITYLGHQSVHFVSRAKQI